MTARTVSLIKQNFDSPRCPDRRNRPEIGPKSGNVVIVYDWNAHLNASYLQFSSFYHEYTVDFPYIRHYNTQEFHHDGEKREKSRGADTVGTPDVNRATGPAICNITADSRQTLTCFRDAAVIRCRRVD